MPLATEDELIQRVTLGTGEDVEIPPVTMAVFYSRLNKMAETSGGQLSAAELAMEMFTMYVMGVTRERERVARAN